MTNHLTYKQIRPIFLNGLLRMLGRDIPGLSLDSFDLIMSDNEQASGSERRQAPGCAFTLSADLSDDPVLLSPIFLHGFTEEDARKVLVPYTVGRITRVLEGKEDPHAGVRKARKSVRFGNMYNPKALPESDDDRLVCRLVGYPTLKDLTESSPPIDIDDQAPQADINDQNFAKINLTTGLLTNPIFHFDFAALEARVFAAMSAPGKILDKQTPYQSFFDAQELPAGAPAKYLWDSLKGGTDE